MAERGGLHVIATERAEARRIDRQLVGRCGRQGDPGTCQMLLSLEDDRADAYFPRGAVSILEAFAGRNGNLPAFVARLLVPLPQIAEEKRHRQMRHALIDLEESLADLLAYSGQQV